MMAGWNDPVAAGEVPIDLDADRLGEVDHLGTEPDGDVVHAADADVDVVPDLCLGGYALLFDVQLVAGLDAGLQRGGQDTGVLGQHGGTGDVGGGNAAGA